MAAIKCVNCKYLYVNFVNVFVKWMGNGKSLEGDDLVSQQSFHSIDDNNDDDGNDGIDLIQSATDAVASEGPSIRQAQPVMDHVKKALSSPDFINANNNHLNHNDDDDAKDELPAAKTDLLRNTSVATSKVIVSKNLRKAIENTPNANILKHISKLFHYQKRLAKGSSCSVLLVRHKRNKKLYALKEMNRLSVWNPILYMTEINVLKMLKDHPNVMTYFDCFVDDKCLYIASEYCSGGTLLDRIIKMNVFTEEIAAKYIATILSAVDYMHERNVCHRDLKPNNIVFDKRGYALISCVFCGGVNEAIHKQC